MRVPDTATAFLLRKVFLFSARFIDEYAWLDECAWLEVAKLHIYTSMAFLCSEKNMSTVFPAGLFRFEWCRAPTQRACTPDVAIKPIRTSSKNL